MHGADILCAHHVEQDNMIQFLSINLMGWKDIIPLRDVSFRVLRYKKTSIMKVFVGNHLGPEKRFITLKFDTKSGADESMDQIGGAINQNKVFVEVSGTYELYHKAK